MLRITYQLRDASVRLAILADALDSRVCSDMMAALKRFASIHYRPTKRRGYTK